MTIARPGNFPDILSSATETYPTEQDGSPVIFANGMEFSFRPKADVPLFSNVSMAVRPCEIVCLLGGSGCGKSTLLRTLAGLQAPTSGSITFLGKPLNSPHPRAAMVFQQPSLLPWLNVAGNVGFGLDFRHQPRLSSSQAAQRRQHAIEAVGLNGKEKFFPFQLSGGLAQRVALARALAREPAVLFADEPFSALDAITRYEMQSLLVRLVREWRSAVVLVTHDIDEAIAIGDRILLMGGKPASIVREWHVPRRAADENETYVPDSGELRQEILNALHALLSVSSNSTSIEAMS